APGRYLPCRAGPAAGRASIAAGDGSRPRRAGDPGVSRSGSAVAFDVLCSVDLAGGRLVRLRGGKVELVDAFGGDPVAAVGSFVEAGAAWVHVVDVDLALTGEAQNLAVLERIAGLGVRVQASGGIVTLPAATAALEAGAAR